MEKHSDNIEFRNIVREVLQLEFDLSLSNEVLLEKQSPSQKFDFVDLEKNTFVELIENADPSIKPDINLLKEKIHLLSTSETKEKPSLYLVFEKNVPKAIQNNYRKYLKDLNSLFSYAILDRNDILELAEKYNFNHRNDDEKFIIDFVKDRNFFFVNHLWFGNDQKERFIKESIWESDDNNQNPKITNSVNLGDILISIGFYTFKTEVGAIGVVSNNPKNGHLLFVNWSEAIDTRIQPEVTIAYRDSISKIQKEDATIILEDLSQSISNLFEIIIELERTVDKNKDKYKQPDKESTQYWWINASDEYWRIDDFKVGDIQTYSTHNRTGTKRQVFQHFFNARIGDLCIGYQSGKKGKTKAIFEITKEALNEKGDGISFKLIRKLKDNEQFSYGELKKLDYFSQSEVVRKNNQGSIFRLTKAEYYEIYSLLKLEILVDGKKSVFTKTGLDNDGAYTTVDLLEIENDVRSFALILAAKDIKPPIAVALFGKWGSGKSFFMEHLSKRVNELSINQGFLEERESSIEEDEEKRNEAFCKGIAQIKFNAWSYLDANLWAGLVTIIFEKLDEFITGDNVKESEKRKVHNKFSESLGIVQQEKKILSKEIEDLNTDKNTIEESIATLKENKENINKEIINQTINDLKKEAKEQTEDIKENVKIQLDKYGIDQSKLNELSPNALFDEVSSWVTFVKNIGQFNKTSGAIGIVILTVMVIYSGVLLFNINPWGFLDRLKELINVNLTLFIGVFGPIFIKVYNSYSKFKKVLQPVIEYKNRFNETYDKIKLDYDKKLMTLSTEVANKEREIKVKENELVRVNTQIEDYEYEIKYSITKRAFNNFINSKSKDENYKKQLGFISIIRKDFETLSALFEEVIIPEKINEEERKKLTARKKENEDFRGSFIKPLDRIILYIDDLDRCSDEKVLEVIQAVHLLMAFPLFNVVVGVDKRCVNNALIYKNLLQYSQFTTLDNIEKIGIHVISPSEFLEKIFQIPFQLDDPSDDDIKGMVNEFLKNQIEEEVPTEEEKVTSAGSSIVVEKDGKSGKVKLIQGQFDTLPDTNLALTPIGIVQVDNQDEIVPQKKTITITPKDLRLTKNELELLKEIIWLVGSIPRTVKRYLNIYRIIQAHKDLHIDADDQRKEFLTLMFLLAINIGEYKDHAPKLLKNIELKKDKRLGDFLVGHADLIAIKNRIESTELIKELLQYEGAQFEKHIPFVGRFSFGNIEYSNNLADKDLNDKKLENIQN